MPKYLGSLRVIVEAEDWNDAFDFLDELTMATIAATDAKIVSSSIDGLTRTRRVGLGRYPSAIRRKPRLVQEVFKW